MDFVLSVLENFHRKLIHQTELISRKRAPNLKSNQAGTGERFSPEVNTEPGPSSSSRVSLEVLEHRQVSSSLSKESSLALPSEESVETAPLSTVESDGSCRSFPLVLSSTRGLRLLTEPQSIMRAEGAIVARNERVPVGRRSKHSRSRTLRRASLYQLLRLMNGFADQEPHMSPRSKRQRSLTRLTGEDDPSNAVAEAQSSINAPKSMVCTPAFINKVFLKDGVRVMYPVAENTTVNYTENEFVQDCLFWHNHLRRKHRVPLVHLCHTLCEQAQQIANAIAHTNDLFYRKLRDTGQNLYVESSYTQENFDVSASTLSGEGETVCQRWYSEQRHYDYYHDQDLLHTQASRFTQMVWKSSQKLGIGKATIGAGKVIVVALYKPAGNVVGEFQNNVFSVHKRKTASFLGSSGALAVQSDDDSSLNSLF